MPKVVVFAIGFATGILAAFGVVVAWFDWAHQGPNTDAWQAVVGWFLPVAVIVAMLAGMRSSPERRRKLRMFGLAVVVGFFVGFGGLMMLF